LATGSRINKGADDPAGLIAVRSLKSELTAVDTALSNNQRTNSILGVAEGSLNEIASLLDSIKSLAQASTNSAGLSGDELAANQSQIDNAIEAIDRIVRTTEFNGKKLLDGALAINTSGVAASAITDVRVFSRSSASTSTTLSVNVTTAATQATISGYATVVASEATQISVQGELGSVVIDIGASQALSAVAFNINAATGQTGVTASASGANLSLTSSDYGDTAFVRVKALSGDTTNYTEQNATGTDAVVTVNGQNTAVDGLTVNYSAGSLSLSFNLTAGLNQATGTSSFSVTTGGATFQLGTTSSTRSTIGLEGLFAAQLGSATVGYLSSLRSGGTNSLVNDPNQASLIASEAAKTLAKAQGRVGGFTKFQVQSAINSLGANKKGLEEVRSVIEDVDYATDTANLNKENVLLQSALALLGVANQQTGQILSLL
jgi:flagellin